MKPQIVRHGEVLLKPISEIPQKATLVKEAKEFIVAHSETGHHHVLELATKALRIYSVDNELYLDVGEVGRLVHKKTGVDIHQPHTIAPGKYKIVIKQAYDYFAKKLTQVRD